MWFLDFSRGQDGPQARICICLLYGGTFYLINDSTSTFMYIYVLLFLHSHASISMAVFFWT